jgi:uncharacterized protein with HEPN domain
MTDKVKVWLEDIATAISEIEEFLPKPRNFKVFQKDLKTKRAIERNIEIIGEAMNRIVKEYPKIKLGETRKIIDTRNRIIHGYDSVSEEIIWSICINDLPKLMKEIIKLTEL